LGEEGKGGKICLESGKVLGKQKGGKKCGEVTRKVTSSFFADRTYQVSGRKKERR